MGDPGRTCPVGRGLSILPGSRLLEAPAEVRTRKMLPVLISCYLAIFGDAEPCNQQNSAN
jgi:hypothetical protein